MHNRASSASDGGADLLSRLEWRAVSTPEEPWIFFRAGWDWQWWSWSQVAVRAENIATGGLSSGPAPPQIESIQSVFELVVLLRSGTPELSQLEQAGSRLEETLCPRPRSGPLLRNLLGAGPGRRIAVDQAELSGPTSNSGWAWSILTGAALLLAPSRVSWLESVLWCRPTDLWGDSSQLEELEKSVGTRAGRLALGRLESFVLIGNQPFAPAPAIDASGLEGLGVDVVLLTPEQNSR